MRLFSVLLSRSETHEARVEVHADDTAEALSLAEQRADDGMVAWTRVNLEVGAQIEEPVFTREEIEVAR